MWKNMIVISTVSAALVLLFTGCRKKLKDFSFSYSMESVNNYKVVVSFDSNKTYKMEKYNYFMDNHANTRKPVIKEGTLTDDEYKTIRNLLSKANLFKMKDSYGFEKEPDDVMGDIIYQIHFHTKGKDKYISMRHSEGIKYPSSFLNLLAYINTFIQDHPIE